METITIALDAMGGDYAPHAVLKGASKLLETQRSLRFLIFGDEKLLNGYFSSDDILRQHSTIYHTDKAINDDDKPSAALRNGKGSSMRMAIEAVSSGQADAVVSAGNTGALMAMAKMVLKTVPGIHRPALASMLPAVNGSSIMLDLGANMLVDADNLVQFAVMGAALAQAQHGMDMPKVGLLNVGTEDNKGPDHVKQAGVLLRKVDFPGHYIGFVEGTDISGSKVDVVVCDGYAGNIALKTAEGFGKLTSHLFKKEMRSNIFSILGSILAYASLKRFKNRMDPRLYNGGVFLGLNGICIKSHGGGDALAFSSALGLAVQMVRQGYIEKVAHDIEHLMSQESFLAS